ncbi:hypothetical protein CEP51_003787 [Fusarium floridanum]|uniref:Uncharacterized protein n=1 Tax=Fusarium floridanum TaxID=1325733 RepID=A0A428S4C2_9HYPO|nr:hypothetical protein CEP51_003787 [Fusarium floridanum]
MIRIADMDGDAQADFLAVDGDGSIRMWKNLGIAGTKEGVVVGTGVGKPGSKIRSISNFYEVLNREELIEKTSEDVDIEEPLAEYAFNTFSDSLEVNKEDLVDALLLTISQCSVVRCRGTLSRSHGTRRDECGEESSGSCNVASEWESAYVQDPICIYVRTCKITRGERRNHVGS